MMCLLSRPSRWSIAISAGRASRESMGHSRKPVSPFDGLRMMRLFICAFFLLATLAPAADTKPSTGGAEFAVVASPDVPADTLSLVDLRKLFLGDRQFWTSNLRVSLLVRAPVARERAAVVWTICKMSEAQFGQHWIGKVMRADCTNSPRL